MGDRIGNNNRMTHRTTHGTPDGRAGSGGAAGGPPAQSPFRYLVPGTLQFSRIPWRPLNNQAANSHGVTAATGRGTEQYRSARTGSGTADGGSATPGGAAQDYHRLQHEALLSVRALNRCSGDRTAEDRRVVEASRRSVKRDRSGCRKQAEGDSAADTAGMISFLRDFPSLDDFHETYPDLKCMTIPADADSKDLGKFLETAIRRDRYDLLKQEHTLQAILLGLRELQARKARSGARAALSQTKSATARPEKKEAAEVEETEAAGRQENVKCRKPEPLGGSIFGFIMNREMGIGPRRGGKDLGSRLAAIGYDRLASLWIMTGQDIGKLRCQYSEIHGLFKKFKTKNESLWDIMSSRGWLNSEKNERIPLIFEPFIDANPTNLRWIIGFDSKERNFFNEAFYLECTLEFLIKAREIQKSETKQNFKDRIDEVSKLIVSVAKTVPRKTYTSVLLYKATSPEFDSGPEFERILVPTLITLFRSGDFRKAREEFELQLKVFCPDLPKRTDDACENDHIAVTKARAAVEKERARADKDDPRLGGFTDEKRLTITEFIDDILYCYFAYANGYRNGDEHKDWDTYAPVIVHGALLDHCCILAASQPD